MTGKGKIRCERGMRPDVPSDGAVRNRADRRPDRDRGGRAACRLVEVGGSLRSYTVAGIDQLDGYGPDEMAPSGRGQVLIPWPNRLRDGTYEFDGTRHQLPLNEPELGNAIHGLVRWAGWSVAEREAHRVVVRHILHPQPGYPFSLALQIEYTLTAEGLSVRTSATNVGRQGCPFGHGAHPWLTFGTATVDRGTLRIPARVVIDADERGLPMGSRPVAGTEFDFRIARPIGARRSTTRSRRSSATRMASPAFRSRIRAAGRSRSGSTAPIPTCSSPAATCFPT